MIKCCQNVDFEEMNTECPTGKQYCEGYLTITSNKIYYGSVKKSKFQSLILCPLQIDKKNNNVPQGEKLTQTLIFPKLLR